MPFDRFWSPSEPIPGTPPDSHEPALALAGDSLHLVWSSNKVIYHAIRASDTWGQPNRVAAGEQPVLAAGRDGRLHCLFVNRFAGNYEIYHVTWNGDKWTLPQPVSRTTGVSTAPALAAAADGSLHAAWTDTTPGYAVIYHGHLAGPIWSSEPIPHARGSVPALAATPSGDLHVAWQDRLSQTGFYEIFAATLCGGSWSLPEVISESPDQHSVRPQLAANWQGGCSLVWQEQRDHVYMVRHAHRLTNNWSVPVDVSGDAADCRQPRVVANPQGFMQVIWLEGNALHHRVRPPDPGAPWWVPQTAAGEYQDLSDLCTAMDANGTLHVVWSGLLASSTRGLFYASRQPIFRPASAAGLDAEVAQPQD